MKQSLFSSGMIPNTDDFDFEARAKNLAIEQTRYDLLEQQDTFVKGVVRGSGLTSSHTDDPLKVYLEGLVVNIYSGVAYDAFERRARRIWVPDVPTDVPLNPAEAESNYDNIDMVDEVQSKDFTTALRPPRTSLKTFSAADASGSWYVCIRFAYGGYDPITVPIDGSQEDSKRYEGYQISVSQLTASNLYTTTGYPWMQLATLSWDGSTLTIASDDRVYASCVITADEELILQHQDRFHGNAIVSEDHSKLTCILNNTPANPRFEIDNYGFTSDEGMHINGYFVQTINNTYVQFDPTMTSDTYYAYMDSEGTLRATTLFGIAALHLILCSFYYDSAANQLRLSAGATSGFGVNDRRVFGTAGKYEVANWIVGDNYDYDGDLSLEEASDEFMNHRYFTHGNGLINYSDTTHPPSSYDDGSLGCNLVNGGTTVIVNALDPGDKLFIKGYELYTLDGDSTLTVSGGAGRKVVYTYRSAAAPDPRHSYKLSITAFSGTMPDHQIPLCTFYWDGAQIVIDGSNPVLDKRVWGTIGYWHTQRNKNDAGNNNLPQPLVCIWGTISGVTHLGNSGDIFLTHDWGNGNGGGGSDPAAGGKPIFAVKPSIVAYQESVIPGVYQTDGFGDTTNGYRVTHVTADTFRIYNNLGSTKQFYWVAIGPAFTNLAATIEGKNNPSYDEAT